MGVSTSTPLRLPDEHASTTDVSVQDLAQWLNDAPKNIQPLQLHAHSWFALTLDAS